MDQRRLLETFGRCYLLNPAADFCGSIFYLYRGNDTHSDVESTRRMVHFWRLGESGFFRTRLVAPYQDVRAFPDAKLCAFVCSRNEAKVERNRSIGG